MKVSIIIAVYNRQDFIAEAINSALEQTYQDIEIIIVDDGSTDNTAAIIKEFEKASPHKIIYLYQANSGAASARNAAINIASGELASFLDSDDIYEKNKTEMQVKFWQQHPQASFVYSGYTIFNMNTKESTIIKPLDKMQGDIKSKLWTVENNIWGGTMLVPMKHLKTLNGFDSSLRGAENFDLRLKLAKLGPVYFQDQLLSIYRIHNTNLSQQDKLNRPKYLKVISNQLDNSENQPLFRFVMSNYHYRSGMFLFQKQQYYQAMLAFLKSIQKKPLQLKSYIQILRCTLGEKINNKLRNLEAATKKTQKGRS